MPDLRNNRNLILILTCFLFSAAVLIGMGQLEATAETQEYIFNEYKIRVKGKIRGPVTHGILPLVWVDSTGDLDLLHDITEISVTDESGQQVQWEEGKPILTQALTQLLHLSKLLPTEDAFYSLPTLSGHSFELMTGKIPPPHHILDIIKTLISNQARAALFKEAVIRAVALEETLYFVENIFEDTTTNFDRENFLKLLKTPSSYTDLLENFLETYQYLRIMSGITDVLDKIPEGLTDVVTDKMWDRVTKKISKKSVEKSISKAKKYGSKAGSYLKIATAALTVVGNTIEAKEKIERLAVLGSQLDTLMGLNSALLLMKATNADPAMIAGMEAAIDKLVEVTKDGWVEAGIEGFWESAPTLAVLVGGALGGPYGAFLTGETAVWIDSFADIEKEVLKISALVTLGNYLHRNLVLPRRDSRIDDLVSGHFADQLGEGFPARELISFRQQIAAETSAWVYNRRWGRLWDNLSLVGLAAGIGVQLNDWFQELGTDISIEEEWKEFVVKRTTAVYYTKALIEKMPTFLEGLKQIYVPRPTSEPIPPPESISTADIALIIDSSGSMRWSDPTNLRIEAAKQFIDLAAATVQIAIIDLDNIVTIEPFAPLTFADDAGKILLKNAVDRIDSDGDENIAEALQQGFNELLASAVPNVKKAAVLLTDGQDDSDTRRVAADYAGRGWSIYTIGLGNRVNRKLLEEIAAATPKGKYFEASLGNIQTVYNKILAETTDNSVLATLLGHINNGQQVTKPVWIDDTADQVITSCTWQGSTIELVLIDPNGKQITPRDAQPNSPITYQASETSASYILENPTAGEWQIQLNGTDIPAQGEPYNLIVSATSDFFTNLLPFDASYAIGDTIRIGIDVQEKTGDTFTAVLGATTSAKIIRPDGKIDTLVLFDDGSHSDGAANDGVYANNYRSVDKQGTYLVKVSAENGFSREIQEQVVVGRIDNVFIDGATLTPAAGTNLDQAPNVISAVISGPAGKINSNSIVLKVDGKTVSHTYDSVNQLVSYKPDGLSGGSHSVQLSVQDTSGNAIETTWQFTMKVVGDTTLLQTLIGHTDWVRGIAFSPDGTTLASGSFDRTIRLWDVNTGRELKKITGHTDQVYTVSFSPDGTTLASGSADRTIRLWDVNTGRELKKIIGHTSWVRNVSFSVDGTTLASGSADRTIRLWDVNTGRELKKIIGHTDQVYTVAFSPDGNTLASGSADRTIRLWDVNTGRELKKIIGHTDYLDSVSFSVDGSTLASGSADHTIRLWDVNTGRELKKIIGHTGVVCSVVFSVDGNTLASGSADRTIRLWDVNTGRELKKITGTRTVCSVVFSPDGSTLASGGGDKNIMLWDVRDFNTGRELKKITGHTDWVRSIAFSPDGNTLASSSRDRTIRLWDVNTTTELKKLTGHTNSVNFIAFSPDGDTLASGSADRTIRLWDVNTATERKKFTGHTNSVYSIAFSPDGNTLASGSADRTIRLWDVNAGTELKKITRHTNAVHSIAFSPDGTTLASGSYDQTIRLWDVNTATELKKLTGHTSSVLSVAFNVDGNTLASGSDSSIRLWDVNTGKELRKLTGHTSSVRCVAFSPDGNTLASGSADNTIRLWDVNTGKELKKITEHTGIVWSVAFSVDGTTLASGSGDKTIRLWDVTPSPVVLEDIAHIYWTDRGTDKIQRANLDGSNVQNLVPRGLRHSSGIALDIASEKMYWTDHDPGKIQRANLDGSNVQDLVIRGLDYPYGIALDITGGKMYWTDVLTGKIQRANLDGTNVQDLVTSGTHGLRHPRGISLDIADGKMYWADSQTAKIQRANLDGTNVQDLVTRGLRHPNGIALDIAGRKMYWTDYGTDKIQWANLDGTNIQDLVTRGLSVPLGITLDVERGKMYWTDEGTSKIQRANLDGTNIQDYVTTGLRGPAAIAISIPSQTPPPVVQEDIPHIYWTDQGTDKIQRTNMDGSNSKDLITTGLDTPQGIAIDVAGEKMYWTDSDTKKIQRANLDGSAVEDLVTGLLGNPDGIALDVANDKMYWTEWITNKIQCANLDGSGVQDLITTGLNGPTGIALDVSGDKMYWTNWLGNTIQCANIDGTGVQELVTGLSLPIGIALDVAGDKMYWTEWAAAKVRCANLDGSNIKDLVTDADGLSEPQGIALDISDGKMYWTDRKTDKIQCANLDGTGVQDLVTGLSEPRGIALGIPIDTPPVVQVVREDVNGDGVVDLQDTAVVTKNLGKTGENAADVNRDGVVDVEDLVLVLAAIEAAAGAPARHTQVSHLFTAEEVQQWLVEARQFANKSPAHRRGILVLEQILALLTPKETALLPNYPNPFNPETWMPYQLAKDADVTLHIYTVNGTLVRTLTLGHKAAGMYQKRSRAAYWDGRNTLGEKVASGVYFYTLTAGDFTATRKMLIRK